MSELLLVGASGLAREVLATVRSSGQYDIAGFLDDEKISGTDVDGAPILGPINDAVDFTHAFVLVCLDSGQARKSMVDRLAALGIAATRYATVLDPTVRTA